MSDVYRINIGNAIIEYIKNHADTGEAVFDKITIIGAKNVGNVLELPDKIDGIAVCIIGKKAFLGNKLLTHVIIPASVYEIQDYAFAQCDNLKTVCILNHEVKLGMGIFTQSHKIMDICMGYKKPDDVSALMGTLTYKLKAEHLINDNTWGSLSWFEKWDMELLSLLRQSDDEGYTDVVLCGEEDIQFSLDEYVGNRRKNKSALCLIRLMHDSSLSEDTRIVLTQYILGHIKGCDSDEAWQALLTEFSDDMDYFRLYAALGGVIADNIDDMIADMGEVSSETKVFLMNYKQEKYGEADIFDMFSL